MWLLGLGKKKEKKVKMDVKQEVVPNEIPKEAPKPYVETEEDRELYKK